MSYNAGQRAPLMSEVPLSPLSSEQPLSRALSVSLRKSHGCQDGLRWNSCSILSSLFYTQKTHSFTSPQKSTQRQDSTAGSLSQAGLHTWEPLPTTATRPLPSPAVHRGLRADSHLEIRNQLLTLYTWHTFSKQKHFLGNPGFSRMQVFPGKLRSLDSWLSRGLLSPSRN